MTYPENQPPAGPQGYWPPQPTPAYAAPTPPASPRRTFWLKGPGLIVLIVAGGLILFGVYAATGGLKPSPTAADDLKVTMTSCEFTGSDSLPSATVGLSVTNNGDRTRSVTIGIEYRDSSGARIDTDTARVRDVAPGDTVRTEETTLLDAGATSGRCEITSIR